MKLIVSSCLVILVLAGIAVSATQAESSRNIDSAPDWIGPYSQKQKISALQQIPTGALAQFCAPADKTVALRNYSITLDPKGKYLPALPPQPTRCGYTAHNRNNRTTYYPVTRPGEKNFVAILKVIGDYQNVLNPIHGFDYGPIPLLADMSVQTADTLWGEALEQQTVKDWQRKVYALESINRNGDVSKFRLTCSFDHGKLSRYELSGPGLNTNLKWNILDDRAYAD